MTKNNDNDDVASTGTLPEERDSETNVEPVSYSESEEEIDSDLAPSDDRLSDLAIWLNRQQWVAVVAFAVGVVLLFIDTRWGFRVVAGSVILAGLFPVFTGYYRSPFGRLRGWQARARGLVSVGIGVMILALVG